MSKNHKINDIYGSITFSSSLLLPTKFVSNFLTKNLIMKKKKKIRTSTKIFNSERGERKTHFPAKLFNYTKMEKN